MVQCLDQRDKRLTTHDLIMRESLRHLSHLLLSDEAVPVSRNNNIEQLPGESHNISNSEEMFKFYSLIYDVKGSLGPVFQTEEGY